MAKDQESILCVEDADLSTSNLATIMKESIELLTKHANFTLKIITLFSSILTFLVLVNILVAVPILYHLRYVNLTYSEDLGYEIFLIVFEIIFLVALNMISICGTFSTIYAAAMTHLGKSATIKDFFRWIILQSSWKKPIITWIYVYVLRVGFAVFILIKYVSEISTANFGDLWHIISVGILILVIDLNLVDIWNMALVVSALEQDVCATIMFAKAKSLIEGRRLQGFLLNLILLVVSLLIFVIYQGIRVSIHGETDLGLFVLRFTVVVICCFKKFFDPLVFTVFYFACKKTHGETIEMKFGPNAYGLLPTEV